MSGLPEIMEGRGRQEMGLGGAVQRRRLAKGQEIGKRGQKEGKL